MTQAVNTIEASIVQIQFIALHVRRPLPDGTTPMVFSSPVGTGFLVNDQYVLTARHVIYTGREWLNQVDADQKKLVVAKPNIQGERYKDATVGLTVRGTFTSYTFEVVDEDGEHDLALLKLINLPRVPPMIVTPSGELPMLNWAAAKLDPRRPDDGLAIGVSGYPFHSPVLVTNGGFLATSWAFEDSTMQPGIPGTEVVGHRWKDIFYADVRVNPGDSGGPVYKAEDGTVIGVCIQQRLEQVLYKDGEQIKPATDSTGHALLFNSGVSVVVPIRYAVELMSKNRVKWIEAPSPR